MGHRESSVFAKYYISQKVQVDTQVAFLGSEPQQQIGEMSRGRDRRTPTKLSDTEVKELEASPTLRKMADTLLYIKRRWKARTVVNDMQPKKQ